MEEEKIVQEEKKELEPRCAGEKIEKLRKIYKVVAIGVMILVFLIGLIQIKATEAISVVYAFLEICGIGLAWYVSDFILSIIGDRLVEKYDHEKKIEELLEKK